MMSGKPLMKPGVSIIPRSFILSVRVRKVCVATLIARQWALTAAHCTEETSLGVATARGGTFAVEVAGQAREIDLVVKHPRYQQGAVDDVDLALIRFKAPRESASDSA